MDARTASARVSSSDSLSAPREEAMLTRSLSTVIFFISSLRNFCIRSPDLTAQDPFSIRATVRFCTFSAFMSRRKLCIAGYMPRLYVTEASTMWLYLNASEISCETFVEDTSYMATLVMPLSHSLAARAWAADSVFPYMEAYTIRTPFSSGS
ncbi:hypothetical protein SDC9_198742 [bioreactor metagenome]|uniref:Uncharacterized protein n=1 Tax=bioreactor metagenome TaxID=1076179 RepID=A0A645IIZ8_9ZZZZ